MQYTYDNSAANPHNPSNPPREVKFGEETTNEMGFAFVSLTLDSPDEVSEFRSGTRAEFIADMLVERRRCGSLGTAARGAVEVAADRVRPESQRENRSGRAARAGPVSDPARRTAGRGPQPAVITGAATVK